MNHQGLLWKVNCIATVVLPKQLTFKSAVVISKRSSCLNMVKKDQLRTIALMKRKNIGTQGVQKLFFLWTESLGDRSIHRTVYSNGTCFYVADIYVIPEIRKRYWQCKLKHIIKQNKWKQYVSSRMLNILIVSICFLLLCSFIMLFYFAVCLSLIYTVNNF